MGSGSVSSLPDPPHAYRVYMHTHFDLVQECGSSCGGQRAGRTRYPSLSLSSRYCSTGSQMSYLQSVAYQRHCAIGCVILGKFLYPDKIFWKIYEKATPKDMIFSYLNRLSYVQKLEIFHRLWKGQHSKVIIIRIVLLSISIKKIAFPLKGLLLSELKI